MDSSLVNRWSFIDKS
ncbi:unnamed protein product [Spirodela intermedia]|uniref:Uncharacterized protein n=2 Tax=Spirodela intermedia TaxID=51605 RepID=A0A7I8JWQ7_SPIIN|nr:unnamed protein product [Spirodela intermedia]CAA6653413.1 unnamed protein product [Spirodela intermedia]CAA7387641.1 unnamed protein product [Spirodela intermedia]